MSRAQRHDILFSLRGALAPLLCGLAGFTLLVTVSTTVLVERSIFNIDYTHEQLRFRFFAEELSLALTLAALVYGAVLALVLLRFLRDKRASTSFFSLGIGSGRLFLHRLGVGVFCLLLGIGLPFAASLALNVAALGWYSGELTAFVYLLCGYLTLGLVAFGLTALACACAGTLFECLAFATTLLAGVSVLMWGLDVLCAQLLVGSPFGKAPFGSADPIAAPLLSATAAFTPALFFADLAAEQQLFRVLPPVYEPASPNWWPLAVWAILALGFAALAALALRRRPGEQAQMAGMNTAFAFATTALAAFALFAALFYVIAPVDLAAALALAAFGFLALSVFLLRGPLKGRSSPLRSLAVLAGECACVAACVLAIASGGFGFSGWVPAPADVRAVSVSYIGTPSYLARPLAGTASQSAYYYHLEYSFDTAAEVAVVQEAHKALIAAAPLALARSGTDFADTVLRYYLVVRYTLQDGSEQVRYYDRARLSDLAGLLALDDCQRLKTLEKAAITADTSGLSAADTAALASANTALAYSSGYVYLADANYSKITALELGEAARAALLRALAADATAQSASARYEQSEQPLGTLMFTLSAQNDAASFGFSFSNAVVPIAPSFSKTRAWFAENGLADLVASGIDPALIEEIAWLADDPYASVVNRASPAPVSRFFIAYRSEFADRFWASPDFGNVASSSDPDQIAAVSAKLRTACFMSGGYLVRAKLAGIAAWVYYYLPAADAPEFMKAG